MTWSSNNPAAATVTSKGVVVGVDTGTAMISAAVDHHSGTATVLVVTLPPAPCPDCALAPGTFLRIAGQTTPYYREFAGDPALDYTLVLQDDGQLDTGAEVVLNGVRLDDAISLFGNYRAEVRVRIRLQPTNVLTVLPLGAAGAVVTAWVTGPADRPLVPGGSVTVDGSVGTAEWADALVLPLTIPLDGGGSLGADLRVLHDGINLYASVVVPRTDAVVVLGLTYDNDGDGFAEEGEDDVFGSSDGLLADGITASCTAPLSCGRNNDPNVGGSNDGAVASRISPRGTEVELAHPLRSGDRNDFQLGSVGRLDLRITVGLVSLGSNWYPSRIRFAPLLVR